MWVAYCSSLSVYLSICASEAEIRAGTKTGAGKNLQERGVREPPFLIKALGILLASSLSAGLTRGFY